MFALILQFLMALPSIWAMVKEILALIHGLPKGEQAGARMQLHTILKDVPRTHTVSAQGESELQVFLKNLKARVAAAKA